MKVNQHHESDIIWLAKVIATYAEGFIEGLKNDDFDLASATLENVKTNSAQLLKLMNQRMTDLNNQKGE
jgi:hypothetical protein